MPNYEIAIYKKLRRGYVLEAGRQIAAQYNVRLSIADSVAHEQWVMGGNLDEIIDEHIKRDYGNLWRDENYESGN